MAIRWMDKTLVDIRGGLTFLGLGRLRLYDRGMSTVVVSKHKVHLANYELILK